MSFARPPESKREKPSPLLSKMLWAFALASINETSKDPKFTSRLLSTPEKALSYTPFDQATFIDHVNQIAAAELLDPRGICYGYHTVSFAYHCLGLETVFNEKIKAISEAREITAEQKEVLEQLRDFQESNTAVTEIALIVNKQPVFLTGQAAKILYINEDKRFSEDVKSVAEQAITLAVTHFGARVGIAIQGKERGHVIGLTAKREEDSLMLETDDPEYFVQVRHDNFSSASADLTKLLSHGHKQNYAHFWSQKQAAPIYLLNHKAEGNGHSYPTQAEREWAQKNQHRFFRTPTPTMASTTAAASAAVSTSVASFTPDLGVD